MSLVLLEYFLKQRERKYKAENVLGKKKSYLILNMTAHCDCFDILFFSGMFDILSYL